MNCNTQHFACMLPIISISRGHFTLTDIKGTDMEAGRDPDLVKIQNCSEHTQSSWNQIRSWKKQHVKLFPNWSLDCYQKIDLPTEVSVIGSTQEKSKFLANSSLRWSVSLEQVVSWSLGGVLTPDFTQISSFSVRGRAAKHPGWKTTSACFSYICHLRVNSFCSHLWNQGQNILKNKPQSVLLVKMCFSSDIQNLNEWVEWVEFKRNQHSWKATIAA